jgi:hypothetical protein
MSEKRYSEDELAAILQDAAQRSTSVDKSYTLAEIQQIASEAEIAPEHIANAAGSLAAASPTPTSLLAGAASGFQLVRRTSRPATAAEILDALSLARQHLGETGATSEIAGGSEWRHDSGFSSSVVSIVPDADGTVIRIDSRADGQGFVLGAGAVVASIAVGFAASSTVAPTFSALAAGLALIPSLAIARAAWNRSMLGSRRRLTALADAIANRLGRSQPDPRG